MPTRNELLAQVRLTLPDKSGWPDSTLNAWIDDAIRFYSAEFPRTLRYTLTLATGTQEYPLPGSHGLQRVLTVEYPTGQTPREFPRRVEESDSAIDNDEAVYYIRAIVDTTTQATDDDAFLIGFGETVTTGEYAAITYSAAHATPTAGTSHITVPPQHWEALIAFCEFRAHWEMETDEAISMTTVTLALAQLGDAARKAWNRYKEVIDRLRYVEIGRSSIIDWHDASGGRIY